MKMQIDCDENVILSEKVSKMWSMCQIGGHSLLNCKPILSGDCKHVLLANDRHVRRYALESGSFLTQHAFGHNCHIVSLQLNQHNNNEVIITSSDGFVVFWNLSDNQKLDELQLKVLNDEAVVANYLVYHNFFFVTVKQNVVELHYCTRNLCSQRNRMDLVSNCSNVTTNSVAFGPINTPKYLAQVYQNVLNIYKIPINKRIEKMRHLIMNTKEFRCVAFHSTDDIIATGDTLGRIILWYNDFLEQIRPTKSVMHWHQLPVADLCFSPEGTYLYSVGEEMVLVRWNIAGNLKGEKNYLPRLGMPIKFVTCDPNHKFLVTSHEDNSILIIGSAMTSIYSSIDELTINTNKKLVFTSGLVWNKKLNTLVLNGRTGHLQFYSPTSQRQLFQLDIVGQNIVSRENNKIMFYTEVTKISVSEDGDWLSTVEMRNDFETLPEIRLKFWFLTNNSFVLNTTIHLPHNSDVNCLQYAPNSTKMVSTSNDKNFKVWDVSESNAKKWWKCSVIGNLNHSAVPSLANWSSDSSTLAVVFNCVISLWDISHVGSLKLIDTLSDESDASKINDRIDFIHFGGDDKPHYFVECRHNSGNGLIRLWNLIDLNVIWVYERKEQLECFALNKWHNILAYTIGATVYFLKLDDKSLVRCAQIENKDKNEKIIYCLFVNEKHADSESSLKTNKEYFRFYCMNEKQELYSLGQNSKASVETKIILSECDQNLTPLALMLVNKSQKKEHFNGEDLANYLDPVVDTSKLVEEMFYNVPSHVLPPIEILGPAFLTSLLKCQSNSHKQLSDTQKSQSESQFAITYDHHYDEPISDEISSTQRHTEIPNAENDDDFDINIAEDYEWLKELNTHWD